VVRYWWLVGVPDLGGFGDVCCGCLLVVGELSLGECCVWGECGWCDVHAVDLWVGCGGGY